MTTKIKFTKMHGAGNDYIYVDTSQYPIADPAKKAIEWSKFHTGIGSDGLILIGVSDKADFSMRIFNADGSEAMMCGNGSRCVGKYVYEYGLTDKTEITLDTRSGIKILKLHVEGKTVSAVTVDMGSPLETVRGLPPHAPDAPLQCYPDPYTHPEVLRFPSQLPRKMLLRCPV